MHLESIAPGAASDMDMHGSTVVDPLCIRVNISLFIGASPAKVNGGLAEGIRCRYTLMLVILSLDAHSPREFALASGHMRQRTLPTKPTLFDTPRAYR